MERGKQVGELCLPPRDFVRRLCQGAFTGAAFHLLVKSTPFSRGYVRAPRHAPIDWRYIDANIQEALLLDPGIRDARKAQRQHCHGVTLGSRSAKCVEADARLEDRIVLAVRGGLSLPAPDNLP